MSSDQYPDALPVTTTGGWARPGWRDILADADADADGAIGWDMLPVYEVQRPLDDIESIWDYASEYRFRWLFPALLDANVHGFSLEFGAREMAEIDLVGKWDRERIPSAGLIDIMTHYSETPEGIIERPHPSGIPRLRAAGDLHRLRPAPRPTLPGN